ncbi:hypothetical protein Ccrd_010566 [Cynara cardunculus var. scolymus]|uniref:Uncharacterized protein n=1 Tax=Cynara cardunculus var. scolymus TaxID=59895 RepID=A0A118K6Q7_CYNCS|nr:hypothetical protein Ccrd_010566 [Cynara cardunculus var. scolymus]
MASLVGMLRRPTKPSDHGGGDEVEDNINTISFTTDCYACTQVGVPVFHSTSCDVDHAQQPQWEASAGSSLIPIRNRPESKSIKNRYSAGKLRPTSFGQFRRVYDPRSKSIQRWNRFVLLARGMALAIDPLFFYVLSIGRGGSPCLYVDGGVAVVVAGLRTLIDCFHVVHMWLQFRVAYVSRESLVIGCGKLVWDPHSIASRYVTSRRGFWYDAFVVFWLLVPRLIEEERIKTIMTTLLLIFVFQFLPKVYHSVSLMTRMAKVTGYIFGTIWWGFALNLIAYFIASHVAGGCWYALAIQRVILCLRQQCANQNACILTLSCTEEVCYEFLEKKGSSGSRCAGNSTMGVVKKSFCLDADGPNDYGIYQWALPVISSNSLTIKILYPIFWGLMSLSTFGNDLDPTSHWLEVIFSICIVLSGLMLFTLLIGVSARGYGEEEEDATSVPRYGVVDEEETIAITSPAKSPPLRPPKLGGHGRSRRDGVDQRLPRRPQTRYQTIIREGDLVQRMVFIVQGSVKSSQNLSKGVVATTFGLDANHLRYITDHFRYKFANERLKRMVRYYSSNWRTWAAVNIQLGWRRYVARRRPAVDFVTSENGGGDRMLRRYAAIFMSIRPHDHLE